MGPGFPLSARSRTFPWKFMSMKMPVAMQAVIDIVLYVVLPSSLRRQPFFILHQELDGVGLRFKEKMPSLFNAVYLSHGC
jgi:hypothetical protein